MTEIERMYSGRLYNPYKVQHLQWLSAKQKMACFNASPYPIEDSAMNILRDVFANLGERSLIIPPVFYDHGWTISIGKHFFANTGLTVLDIAPVVYDSDESQSDAEKVMNYMTKAYCTAFGNLQKKYYFSKIMYRFRQQTFSM